MSIKTLSFLILGAVVLLVVAYAGTIIYFTWPITSTGNIDKAGVFGDSFGLLTSLFSGLAFAGIVLTILLQREELQLQRAELQLTRKELGLTRKEMKNQNDVLRHQNFESTFFQMLRLHNQIIEGINVGELTGRDCFFKFTQSLRNRYAKLQSNQNVQGARQLEDARLLEVSYDEFWRSFRSDLGHYFRYLYTIFKFIQDSSIENKKLYSNIVRAQLSDQELLLLFYNCLNKNGNEKFKPLAEEFELFNNLPDDILFEQEHRELFNKNAFGTP